MENDITKLLFALVRLAITGTKLNVSGKGLICDETLTKVLEIAGEHDIAHLAAFGLKKSGTDVNNELGKRLKKEIFRAVYRREQQDYELNILCQTFEEAKIKFVPLKGSVIRDYYPEPWMRTSCDIDILVRPKEADKAAELLIKSLGYTENGRGSHDISLISPRNVHIELHFKLVEDGLKAASYYDVLNHVWDYTSAKSGYTYWLEMSDEMFYFYHIAHMAKHFESGGCGIRPFIDLWLLDKKSEQNRPKRDKLLRLGNLFEFAGCARKLSRVWMENAEDNPTLRQMQNYIIAGKVYGTIENQIKVQQQKKGGRVKYALYKIFIPYDVIKYHYPILQEHRALTPIMEVRRWGKLIFCGHAKRTLSELNYNKNVSDEEASEMKNFLKSIGLNNLK